MTIATGAFTNSGNVVIDATRTLTRTGPYTQTAGTTKANGTLTASGGIQLNGGTLSGNGAVSVQAASLRTAARSHGDAIGCELSNGLAGPAAGTLSFDIGGLTNQRTTSWPCWGPFNGVFGANSERFDPVIGNTFHRVTIRTSLVLGCSTAADALNLGRRVRSASTTAVMLRLAAGTVVTSIATACSPQIDIPALLAAINPAAFTVNTRCLTT
jgi:hypothetical protein